MWTKPFPALLSGFCVASFQNPDEANIGCASRLRPSAARGCRIRSLISLTPPAASLCPSSASSPLLALVPSRSLLPPPSFPPSLSPSLLPPGCRRFLTSACGRRRGSCGGFAGRSPVHRCCRPRVSAVFRWTLTVPSSRCCAAPLCCVGRCLDLCFVSPLSRLFPSSLFQIRLIPCFTSQPLYAGALPSLPVSGVLHGYLPGSVFSFSSAPSVPRILISDLVHPVVDGANFIHSCASACWGSSVLAWLVRVSLPRSGLPGLCLLCVACLHCAIQHLQCAPIPPLCHSRSNHVSSSTSSRRAPIPPLCHAWGRAWESAWPQASGSGAPPC